jgi:hypothetical protein
MRNHFVYILIATLFLAVSCSSSSGDKNSTVAFIDDSSNKKIEVRINDKHFTTLLWTDNITKPVLHPVCAPSGIEITRGFPLNPRLGERIDHAHQIGNWLTYGEVDEFDFWGNGSRGLGTANDNGGFIKNMKVEKMSGGKGEGKLLTSAEWVAPTGEELLKEKTTYCFIAKKEAWIIDRITTLTAGDKDIDMPDTKEGMFGIRVARQLELPSGGDVTVYGAGGQPEKIKGAEDKSVTGNYLSSEGVTGEKVWATRARWMDLYGSIGNEKISVVICDHPKNPGYPTYWHARGYGLFAANPLGWNDFTAKKEQFNFKIPAGESVTFRYRTVVSSGAHLSPEQIDVLTDEFAGKYK